MFESWSNSSFDFGLKNYGNTCFMNALFRCLYQVEPFREEMIKIGKFKKSSGKSIHYWPSSD